MPESDARSVCLCVYVSVCVRTTVCVVFLMVARTKRCRREGGRPLPAHLHCHFVETVGDVAGIDDLARLADLKGIVVDVHVGVLNHARDLDVQIPHPRAHVLVARNGRLH